MSNFTLFTGSMYSGKSTSLINVIENYDRAKKNILLLSHKIDKRYDESSISTHNKKLIKCNLISTLDDAVMLDLDRDAIFIDEIQFFKKEVIEFIINHKGLNTKLYMSGLDLNWKGEPFETTQFVMSYSDKIFKLKTICDTCKKYAHCISHKIDNTNNNIIDVGGKNKYIPICQQCFKLLKEHGNG